MHHINQYENKMYTNYTMKEATNKQEVIISICDVLKERPVWLNKCLSNLSVILQNSNETNQNIILQSMPPETCVDLFVEFKKEYYNFKDNTVWS